MMEIVHKILSQPYFSEHPPVLIDVGASGDINPKWAAVAPYAICFCFDADERDFKIDEVANSGYRKLIKINRVITDKENSSVNFYLTASPYCSGSLEPFEEALRPWSFSDYFKVNETVSMSSTTLGNVLSSAGIGYADWLKLDTQGTDLRLYTSLPEEIKKSVLAAELEPGIIDAYKGEDKLHHVLAAMHDDGFWLSKMDVKGTHRITKERLAQYGDGNTGRAVPVSPGWAELFYLRQVKEEFSIRSLYLLYVFALLQDQLGFALEVCEMLKRKNNDKLTDEMIACVDQMIDAHDIRNVTFKTRIKNFLRRKLKL